MTAFSHFVFSVDEIRKLEKKAKSSQEELMDLAGKNIAEFLLRRFSKRPIWILAGKGNNGADGLTAAKNLQEASLDVQVFAENAGSFLFEKKRRKFLEKGKIIPLEQFLEKTPCKHTILVDALLGIGCNKPLKGKLLQVVEKISSFPNKKVSIDIPSGIDSDTGDVWGLAVSSDETLCLGAYKQGLFLGKGYEKAGNITLLNIRLPLEKGDPSYAIVEEKNLPPLPKIKKTRQKYDAGLLLGIAGSSSMIGASKLACLAAIRSGAGLVRLWHLGDKLEPFPSEIMAEPWDKKAFLSYKKQAKALFLGPGLGRSLQAKNLIKEVLFDLDLPLVLDADALFFLAKSLKLCPENAVLTPHFKEMQRFFPEEKHLERRGYFSKIQKWVNEKNLVFVLKGAPTIIFSKNTIPWIVPRGSPAMAKAGVGDVLTGVIAAFLTQGQSPLKAAILGVYLHATAGESVQVDKSSYGLIASDLIEKIPSILSCWEKNHSL